MHAKSTAVTHAFVLASVLFRVNDFVIIVSDTEGQAQDFLGDIKKELEANDRLKQVFGIAGYVTDSKTDIEVKFDDGATFRILAKGSEQKVRGLKWHNKRPNLIVCDDMENDEIVMNPDRREKFRKWFNAALMPCLAPDGKLRIVGTILHLDAWLARLMPQEGFKHTVVTPLKTYSTKFDKYGWVGVLYRGHVGTNPRDITCNADILWPERFNKEWFLASYKTRVDAGHPEVYAQEVLNRPLDESNAYFRKNDFQSITQLDKKEIDEGQKPLVFYAGVDLAISEKERADYSVFQVVGVDNANVMYHTDIIKARLDGREIVDTLFQLQHKYKLNFIAIEDEKIAKSLGPFIKEEMMRRGVFLNLVPIRPVQDKPTRARPLQARMRMGTVKFYRDADYYQGLESEFLAFPRGIHDDQVDALALICLALEKLQPAPTAQELDEEEWEELEYNSKVFNIGHGRSRITGY